MTAEGSSPLLHKIQALFAYPKLDTLIELRRFLGVINYYRRCAKRAGETQAPLNNILKDVKKNDKKPVPWLNTTEAAFAKCK